MKTGFSGANTRKYKGSVYIERVSNRFFTKKELRCGLKEEVENLDMTQTLRQLLGSWVYDNIDVDYIRNEAEKMTPRSRRKRA